MTLIYYPHPVFKQKSQPVIHFDKTLDSQIEILTQTLQDHRAIGVGANMCGLLSRIIIVPATEDAENNEKIVMINPEITARSTEMQTYLEASLSLPGIEAEITRPATITVSYQDRMQKQYETTISGFVASVIQHEIDYLDGIIYLDYLPKVKAKMLKTKMQAYLKKMQRHQNHHHHHHHDGHCCDKQH